MLQVIADLQKGLYDVVKASLAGSVIGNILLVFGLSAFAGGISLQDAAVQCYSRGRAQAILLTLAAIGLIIPAAFHHLQRSGNVVSENALGLDIAIVLLLAYAAHLVFSLHTHKTLFQGRSAPNKEEGTPWGLRRAVVTLAACFCHYHDPAEHPFR